MDFLDPNLMVLFFLQKDINNFIFQKKKKKTFGEKKKILIFFIYLFVYCFFSLFSILPRRNQNPFQALCFRPESWPKHPAV